MSEPASGISAGEGWRSEIKTRAGFTDYCLILGSLTESSHAGLVSGLACSLEIIFGNRVAGMIRKCGGLFCDIAV